MTDKRKETRTAVTHSVTVLNDENGEELGTLVNISPRGIGVRGEKEFYEGEDFEMMLVLERAIFGLKRILVDTECVWSSPEEGTPFFQSGFKFTHVSAGDANLILGFIMDQ